MAPLKLAEPDRLALRDVFQVRPGWIRDLPAREAVNLPDDCLLHAGPAFTGVEALSRPILHSACVAAVFEGLAADFSAARDGIERGDIRLVPAQDFGVVVPLAMVVSASMIVHEIINAAAPESASATRAYAPLNGGSGPSGRLGLCNMQVLNHLQWLNGPFAKALRDVRDGPVDLIDIADRALAAGDDGHGRTVEATAILTERCGSDIDPQALTFLQQGPSFFLNLWMAACKCMVMAAAAHAGSSAIIAAGANGREFGIKVAGRPDHWFTAEAAAPKGELGEWPQQRALGAIGDSAIVDLCGFGAMAMAHAPAQAESLGPHMPADGLYRPAQLFAGRHPAFRHVSILAGLYASHITALGKTPLISLGILDREGEAGRLGGGIYEAPMAPFAQAAAALEARPDPAPQKGPVTG